MTRSWRLTIRSSFIGIGVLIFKEGRKSLAERDLKGLSRSFVFKEA